MQASVLLLDPDTTHPRQVRQTLERQGDYVLGVTTAALALGMLRHVHVDLLLLPRFPLTISRVDLAAQAKLLQPHLDVRVLDDLALEPGATLAVMPRRSNAPAPAAPSVR